MQLCMHIYICVYMHIFKKRVYSSMHNENVCFISMSSKAVFGPTARGVSKILIYFVLIFLTMSRRIRIQIFIFKHRFLLSLGSRIYHEKHLATLKATECFFLIETQFIIMLYIYIHSLLQFLNIVKIFFYCECEIKFLPRIMNST